MSSDLPLPDSVRRVADLDPALGRRVVDDVSRLVRATEALAWAQARLPALVAAPTPRAVLALLVREALELTRAPTAFALTWSGDLGAGRARMEALAGAGEALGAPEHLSRTIVGQVARGGRPAWSDDAAADARFTAAHSVQQLALRSVGCLPVGATGALYLADPDHPARFGPAARARLAALCALAAAFVGPAEVPPPPAAEPLPDVIGSAPVMLELAALVRAFAPMPWPALILGETGVGKELVARALHALSPRAEAPFVPVNCGNLGESLADSTLFGHERGAFTGAVGRHGGLIERVRAGTLFLDEVGELGPEVQVKLLRLLQEGTYERVGGTAALPFRGRVLAATHRAVEDPTGPLRADLFHRLSACVVRVPPLRERRGDIGALAAHLLARSLAELPDPPELTLGAEALDELERRAWPGNVRELENVLRGAVARSLAGGASEVGPEHLAYALRPSEPAGHPEEEIGDLVAATEAFQRRRVLEALEACEGNRTRAAQRLGVSRQWLHRLIRRWDP